MKHATEETEEKPSQTLQVLIKAVQVLEDSGITPGGETGSLTVEALHSLTHCLEVISQLKIPQDE